VRLPQLTHVRFPWAPRGDGAAADAGLRTRVTLFFRHQRLAAAPARRARRTTLGRRVRSGPRRARVSCVSTHLIATRPAPVSHRDAPAAGLSSRRAGAGLSYCDAPGAGLSSRRAGRGSLIATRLARGLSFATRWRGYSLIATRWARGLSSRRAGAGPLIATRWARGLSSRRAWRRVPLIATALGAGPLNRDAPARVCPLRRAGAGLSHRDGGWRRVSHRDAPGAGSLIATACLGAGLSSRRAGAGLSSRTRLAAGSSHRDGAGRGSLIATRWRGSLIATRWARGLSSRRGLARVCPLATAPGAGLSSANALAGAGFSHRGRAGRGSLIATRRRGFCHCDAPARVCHLRRGPGGGSVTATRPARVCHCERAGAGSVTATRPARVTVRAHLPESTGGVLPSSTRAVRRPWSCCSTQDRAAPAAPLAESLSREMHCVAPYGP